MRKGRTLVSPEEVQRIAAQRQDDLGQVRPWDIERMRDAMREADREDAADTIRAALWVVVALVVFLGACMGAVTLVDRIWK